MPNSKIKFLLLSAVFIIFTAAGCDRDGISSIDDNPTYGELLKSPQIIEIGRQEFVLSAFLWRDFMPVSPPDGKEMTAIVKVIVADSSKFPTSIKAGRMWVINDNLVWSTTFSETQFGGDYELVKVARGGPKWGPEIDVDIVVELIVSDKRFYLKTDNVEINRTD